MRISTSAAVILLLSCLCACATHRSIVPTVSESSRDAISLRSPLRIALLDARTEKENSQAVVQSLQSDLSNIYGESLDWVPYFEETPTGQVAFRIRLMACGADFGSRLVTASAIVVTSSTSSASAATPWGPVMAAGTSEQTLLASGFSGEGWWIGTAWLEIEIEDRRFSEGERFSFPIVAEDRESNLWGYRSGNQAAWSAWGTAAQGLVSVIDAVLVAIRDSETP